MSREVATPPLTQFIEDYRRDTGVWAELSDAHRQNLFEEAIEQIDALRCGVGTMAEEIARLRGGLIPRQG